MHSRILNLFYSFGLERIGVSGERTWNAKDHITIYYFINLEWKGKGWCKW